MIIENAYSKICDNNYFTRDINLEVVDVSFILPNEFEFNNFKEFLKFAIVNNKKVKLVIDE